MLNENGKRRFLKYWRCFEKLSTWHHLSNPISHYKSLMFLDILQLTMLMPFILRHFLTPTDITPSELKALCNHLSSADGRRISPGQAIYSIISCWVIVADAAVYCFKLKLTTPDLSHLQDILMEECHILIQVIFKYIKML